MYQPTCHPPRILPVVWLLTNFLPGPMGSSYTPLTFKVCGSSLLEVTHSGFWLYLLRALFSKLENPLEMLSSRWERVYPARKERPSVKRFSTSTCADS